MSAVQVFDFESTPVRTVDHDGETWFVGIDVCRAMDIANPHDAMASLDHDERETIGLHTLGNAEGMRNPNVVIISEPGVYRLVFRSRKPEAERFKRWLAHEVLPAIRRTGRYGPAPEPRPAPFMDMDMDDLPLGAMRLKLDLVREARLLFGRKRAASLWRETGLATPEPEAPAFDDQAREDGVRCLAALLEWQPDGDAMVAELIRQARDGEPKVAAFLERHGIRADLREQGFVVANRMPVLQRMFARTPWNDNNWSAALRALDGAMRWKSMKFNGHVSRGTFLPFALVD